MLTAQRFKFIALLSLVALVSLSCAATEENDRVADIEECDAGEDAPGVTDDEIKLGTTTPLTGPAGFAGVPAVEGQEWVFEAANEAGGIDGRRIEFVPLDDTYDPAAAQDNTRRLVDREGIFAMSGSIGTPNFVGILPYVDSVGIPAIAPFAPAREIGTMENPHVWMIWLNYIDEFHALADYLIKEEGAETFSLVSVRGDISEDSADGVRVALEANGLPADNLLRAIPYDSGVTEFTGIARDLRTASADFLLMNQSTPDVAPLIRAVRAIGYDPGLGGVSDLLDEVFIEEFGELADGLIAPHRIAHLEESDDPAVRDFVDSWTEDHGAAPTSWQAVGYAQGLVTVEALENAPALTRDCLEWSLENMRDFETGVIPPVSFGPEERQGVRATGIGMVTPEGLVSLREFAEIGD